MDRGWIPKPLFLDEGIDNRRNSNDERQRSFQVVEYTTPAIWMLFPSPVPTLSPPRMIAAAIARHGGGSRQSRIVGRPCSRGAGPQERQYAGPLRVRSFGFLP